MDAWHCYRFDEFNVVLTKEGEDENKYRFYPNFKVAILQLFALLIEPTKPMDLAGLRQLIITAEQKILTALTPERVLELDMPTESENVVP